MRHKHLAAGDIPAVGAQEEVPEAALEAALEAVPGAALGAVPAEVGAVLAVRVARMDVIA